MPSDMLRDVKELIKAHGTPEREVYLDGENSGMVFPEALRAMVNAYRGLRFAHPSITHRAGWESYEALYEATETIAGFIGAEAGEITYTHSGTEANNLAIIGAALANKSGRRKIVVSSIEHLSVIFPAESLRKVGYKLVEVPVDREGFVEEEAFSNAIDRDVFLVSVAAVNHEIGTVQDLKGLVEIARDKNPDIIFHTDAVDALGRVKFDVRDLDVDMATLSSHKCYGPKGAGALYIRDGVKVEPILHGQLSTQRLWPGVENVPAIIGFAKAVELLDRNFDAYVARMRRLRDMLIEGIMSSVEHVILNGPRGARRAPDNVNVSFLFCEGEAITVELSLKGIYVSSGSACTSRVLEPSHVLLALGRLYEEAHGSILMKVSPMHSEDDIRYVLRHVPEAISRIRSISPIKGEVG